MAPGGFWCSNVWFLGLQACPRQVFVFSFLVWGSAGMPLGPGPSGRFVQLRNLSVSADPLGSAGVWGSVCPLGRCTGGVPGRHLAPKPPPLESTSTPLSSCWGPVRPPSWPPWAPKGVLAGPRTPRDPKSHLFVTNWDAIQPFCMILRPGCAEFRRGSRQIGPTPSISTFF